MFLKFPIVAVFACMLAHMCVHNTHTDTHTHTERDRQTILKFLQPGSPRTSLSLNAHNDSLAQECFANLSCIQQQHGFSSHARTCAVLQASC